MVKDGTVNVRVNKRVKTEAENCLSRYGITVGEAVNMLLYQIINHDGLPFELKPTRTTMNAYNRIGKEVDGKENMVVNDVNELFV